MNQYGDSVTYGLYLPDPATQRYGALLSKDMDIRVNTRAISGDMACDLWPRQLQPNLAADSPTAAVLTLYTVLVGTNDVNIYGPGAYETTFNACQQALLSWLAVPDVDKALPGSAAFTSLSGGNNPAISAAIRSIANAATMNLPGTLRATITTYGKPIYIWQYVSDTVPGKFYISIDSGAQSGPYSTMMVPAMATQNGTTASVALTGRFPVSAGKHTVDFIWSSGFVGIVGVGSLPAGHSDSSPVIAVGQVPAQLSTGGIAPPANIAQYNTDIASSIALIAQDGSDIRYVLDQNYMQGQPAEMYDQLHPNALGQRHLADAFEQALK